MAISLLSTTDIVSLEFAPEEQPAVKAMLIELFGETQVIDRLTYATVRVGGEDFTYQNEWDDPCLITSTARGAEMLRAVADRLSG